MKSKRMLITIATVAFMALYSCSNPATQQGALPDVQVTTGYSENPDPQKGVEEAVKMALAQLEGQPLKGIIFYENYKFHENEPMIGRYVQDQLPEGVPSVGVRAIPHTDAGTLWENAISVLAFAGDDVSCNTYQAGLHDNRMRMGTEMGEALGKLKDLSLVMVLSEPNLSFAPNHVSVEDFLHGLHNTLPKGVMVLGGNGEPNISTDAARPELGGEENSLQFHNGEYFINAVVGMGIAGPVKLIGNNANEFYPSEEKIEVTKASEKWVMEFNGRPAADVYRELSGKSPDAPITYDKIDPIGIDLGDGQVYLRMVLFEKKADADYTETDLKRTAYIEESKDLPVGSLRFIAAVPEGITAFVMHYKPSARRILASATHSLQARLNELTEYEKPLALLTSSCCARRTRLRELDPDADEVTQGIHPAMDTKFPVFGLDAWGELGPINRPYKGLPYQYQQHTFVSGILVLNDNPENTTKR